MGYQVWVYEWPENQECLGCRYANSILTSEDWVDGAESEAMSICTLNHDKMCDRKIPKWKCSLFAEVLKEVTNGANNSNNTTERNG